MLDGTRLTFGFHGIWQGTAVLYDEQTGSLWMHFTGACFEGRYAGRRLARLDTGRHTTWADWSRTHPATDVLAPDPRYVDRPGDQGYFSRLAARSGARFLPPSFVPTIQTRSRSLPPNALCYGVRAGGRARAYAFADLRGVPVVEERLGEVQATVWFDAASRSAAAFERRLEDGRLLHFTALGEGRLRDEETGSSWTMDGACVGGALQGARLRALDGLTTEWYGWYAHHPDTTIWRP